MLTLDPGAAQRLRNRLKLRQLQLLAAMASAPSLHQAAASLGMSQPAATRLLQSLEDALDAQVFERTNKGLAPTDTGRMLIRNAVAMMSTIDHVYAEAEAIRRGHAGSLRVGLFPGAYPGVVARTFLRLKRAMPTMELHIQDGSHDTLLAALRAGQLNVVIGRAPHEGAWTEPDLHLEHLANEHFSVVCRTGHPLSAPYRRNAQLGLQDLIGHPWVLPAAGTPLRGALNTRFVGQCGQMPLESIDSSSLSTTLALLHESAYVALVQRAVARHHSEEGTLHTLIDAVPDLVGAVMVIVKKDAMHAPHLRKFVSELRLELAGA